MQLSGWKALHLPSNPRGCSPIPMIGHIVTFGPNGSGKSRRLLLPNLVRLTDWSMLVVDPKGDLAAMTAAYRQKQGSKIVILNPFRVHDWKSHGYNPIAALDPKSEDFPDDALGLAEAYHPSWRP